jgi:phosphate-selective porin OprO/OprP
VLLLVLSLAGASLAQSDPVVVAPDDAKPSEHISEEEYQELSEDAVSVKRPARSMLHLMNPFEYTLRWHRGVRLERNDGWSRMKLGARLEGDFATIHADDAIEAEIGGLGTFGEARRAWITLSGTIGSRVIYKGQVDVTGNSAGDDDRNPYIRQLFLGVAGLGPLGTVRLGFQKEPFSINELDSSLSMPFMERALPAVFAPNYNLGVSSQSRALDDRIAWQFGFFRYSGVDGGGARLNASARLTGLPIYADEGRRLLHLGASYSHQFRDDYELRYRRRPETHLAERFVDTGEFATEGVDLFSFEAAALLGPTLLQGEFVLSKVLRPSESDVIFWGSYVQVSRFLTGEHRSYRRFSGLFGRVDPKRSMDWRGGGWGAWELAARYSFVDLDDDDVRGGRLGDISLGVNWYPYAHVRLMANYVHAHLRGVGRANIFQMRLGVDF